MRWLGAGLTLSAHRARRRARATLNPGAARGSARTLSCASTGRPTSLWTRSAAPVLLDLSEVRPMLLLVLAPMCTRWVLPTSMVQQGRVLCCIHSANKGGAAEQGASLWSLSRVTPGAVRSEALLHRGMLHSLCDAAHAQLQY